MPVNTKAARTRAKRAGRTASDLRSNPYVQRLIEDPELRDNVRSAVESARKAYKRMQNGKGPAKALMEDRKVQRNLKEAADSLKTAADHARGKTRKRRPLRRLIGLAIIGGIIAMIASEGARKAVLDKLFGAEEEFDFSSTTPPASAPSDQPVSSA
jgi:hypothetical protein